MFELLGGLLSGGATGLLGMGLQSLFGWLGQREKNKHALAIKEEDRKYLALEGDNAVRVAATVAEGQENVQDGKTQAASYSMEPKRYATGDRPDGWVGSAGWVLMVFVDTVRGLIRPGLTIYLTWLTAKLYEQSTAIVASIDDGVLVQGIMEDTYRQIVFTICYLFSTCVTWWFGTRMKHLKQK